MSNSEEMKFESLAQLISTHHEENKTRLKDFKDFMDQRFTGLENHNRKQNGTINKTLERVADIEKEQQERALTCKAAVEVLQEKTRYVRVVEWIDRHPKTFIISVVLIIILSQTFVHVAVEQKWIGKLIELIVR